MMSTIPDDADLVARLRRLLLEEEEALEQMAARSYLHVNHFVKIPLARTADHVLRLHIWAPPQSAAYSVQNPHSHGWAFRSRIVRGSFTHTLFADTDMDTDDNDDGAAAETKGTSEEEEYRRHTLDLMHPDSTTKLSDAGAAQLAKRCPPILLCAGDTYDVGRRDIHTFAPTTAGGITLVQTETQHDDVAHVYHHCRGDGGTTNDSMLLLQQKTKQPSLTVEALRAHLESVVEIILAATPQR